MDPVTQGALGGAVAWAVVGPRFGRRTWWLGALGGMAADLDFLIRSATDPLVALEYHRHFTHSLAFVPIGGALAALPWLVRTRDRSARIGILAATTLGYATHGLLDAFTTYGTLLWWPFSRTRVSWNTISIVDLAYTVPLIVGVVLGVRRMARRPAAIGLALATAYMCLCGIQHHRAAAAQRRLLGEREHLAAHALVAPTLGNNVLWRSLYESGGQLHADAIRVPYFGAARVAEGEHRPAPDLHQLAGKLTNNPRGPADLRLLAWFSEGWAFFGEAEPGTLRICDARIVFDPRGFAAPICARLRDEPDAAAEPARLPVPDDAWARLVDQFAELPGERVLTDHP